jgi:two-component system CheB/CheR fusion protein
MIEGGGVIHGSAGDRERRPPHLSAASFPIVAVGASAGGLAPTVELLRSLGTEPKVAVVVVHHLDPTHESGLVEVLSRATAMSVATALDDARVEVNHVYVVPPNAGLLIVQGALKVVPRLEEGGLHLPIDRLFESLALDCDGLSVGVVLSGSGFDGTEGVKAIKREGGIVLAQDEGASFRSMPQSAVATGCVDCILPPAGLAREIARIGANGPALRAMSPSELEEPDYVQVLAAMRKASGVDFASYKPSTVRRRLQRRIFLRGLSDLAGYLELLKADPDEIGKLCEEALIHVTGFFREPKSFEVLRTVVFPKLCEDRPSESTLRVWVPGCSTGEEVYSIAICLLEFLGETHKSLNIKIFGTDLSVAVIDRARAGRYPESIERDVSPGRLQRFFTRDEAGYQIRRDVRDLCVFAKHDVTRDPPFSGMDLISCRNVMIYLGAELQDRVIALLHYALREPGLMVLGSSETHRAFAGFVALEGKSKIYARTSAASRLAFDFATPSLLRDPGAAAAVLDRPVGARSPGASDVHREADRLVLAEFAPPGVVVTNDLAIVQFRGQTGPFLEPTPGAASLDLLRMAREELRLPLRRAIDRARAEKRPAKEMDIVLAVGEKRRTVTLEVIPFAVHASPQRFFLVLFEDVPSNGATPEASLTPVASQVERAGEDALRQELGSTRQYLESVIEQAEATNEELRAANEEIVSSNEELRSTNEELQSAKEELQATNEELRTINDEMTERNVEAKRLNDDLSNVLTSVEIPILIVGRDLRLRRFTPAAAKVFGLLAADVDRPIGQVRGVSDVAPTVLRLIPDVLERLGPLDCPMQDADGRWHHLSVRPYITLDGRIDGTVITARDVDAERRSADRQAAAMKYAEDIVETAHEGLVVLDKELRVRSSNLAFQDAFGLTPEDAVGRRVDELGRPALATLGLRKALDEIRAGARVRGFRLESAVESDDPRSFSLNGRRIEGTDLFLVAFADVTEAERASRRRTDLEFRDALNGAAEGILMVDPDGRIQFANPSVTGLYGYEVRELMGLSADCLLPDRHREEFARRLADLLAEPKARSLAPTDLVGLRKDGTEFAVELSASVMQRARGPMVVAFVSDVTQSRKAVLKIRAYQDRLRHMAFDAALTEEQERRRIAVELHDTVGQELALARIKLAPLQAELEGEQRTAAGVVMDTLKRAIDSSSALAFELSPPILYDLGLGKALAWLADAMETLHGFKLEVIDDGATDSLDDAAKAIVFRSVRELLMNVLKHAEVGTAKVSLHQTDQECQIDVVDSGIGFDPDRETASRSNGGGFGLLSVHEQITRLGGTLNILSAPQRGTDIRILVPLRAREEGTS